ncbi:hypothetical protein I4F81_002669 [Pyropia yezoensis]|uniref:Uncharacterized protein n=1 Tax=Pyropia yezoensis TaxID=2788 RepID=A0ACC3BQ86_PYRYE|nr:hypothetical protein I4F81_002669 [Neopyropia yezoensis]
MVAPALADEGGVPPPLPPPLPRPPTPPELRGGRGGRGDGRGGGDLENRHPMVGGPPRRAQAAATTKGEGEGGRGGGVGAPVAQARGHRQAASRRRRRGGPLSSPTAAPLQPAAARPGDATTAPPPALSRRERGRTPGRDGSRGIGGGGGGWRGGGWKGGEETGMTHLVQTPRCEVAVANKGSTRHLSLPARPAPRHPLPPPLGPCGDTRQGGGRTAAAARALPLAPAEQAGSPPAGSLPPAVADGHAGVPHRTRPTPAGPRPPPLAGAPRTAPGHGGKQGKNKGGGQRERGGGGSTRHRLGPTHPPTHAHPSLCQPSPLSPAHTHTSLFSPQLSFLLSSQWRAGGGGGGGDGRARR